MKIKFSKFQWEKIGKKAGWLKKSQVQSPTKAPVKTPVKSPDKVPTERPKGPFQPPRPKVLPNPKGIRQEETKEELEEDNIFESELKKHLLKLQENGKIKKVAAKPYEKGAHPTVQDFWMNIPKDHPFRQHPILSEYGHNLSMEGYDYITKKTDLPKKESPIGLQETMNEIRGLLQKIIQLESKHEEELIEEAKNITAEIWGIDKSMLDGFLGMKKEEDQGDSQEEEEEGKEVDIAITPVLREEINKRITMNALTHGSSLHAMDSVHYLVAEKLRKISPDLINLYTRLSSLVTQHYYILNIPAIIAAYKNLSNLSAAGIGWSHIEYKEDRPKVVANGVVFPVLCQEFFKGVMELLSFHGISQNLSEAELGVVYKHADRLEDEPWLETVGPALWRKFLSVIPKDISLSDIVMKLNQQSSKQMNIIIKNVIQNPNQARQLLLKFVEKKGEIESYIDNISGPESDIVGSEDRGGLGFSEGGELISKSCPSCGYEKMIQQGDEYICPICNYSVKK